MSMPRCLRYQARKASASLALMKMPPIPVTRAMTDSDEFRRGTAPGWSASFRQLRELRQIVGDVMPRRLAADEHMAHGLDAWVVVERAQRQAVMRGVLIEAAQ